MIDDFIRAARSPGFTRTAAPAIPGVLAASAGHAAHSSVDVARCVAGLETRMDVSLQPGPDVTIQADGDQIEQLLINLVRNAVDASLETSGGVRVHWRRSGSYVDIFVHDDGPGLSNTTNLFVPFFTTKPGGSGIGLVLSRQIAEAHGGTLTLENRESASGCEARLRLRV